MPSMVAAGAHTPREKTLRPFFLATAKKSPAALIRRVSAASPGGTSTLPSGTLRTSPSAARTVFGVGPGEKASFMLIQLPCHHSLRKTGCRPAQLLLPSNFSPFS